MDRRTGSAAVRERLPPRNERRVYSEIAVRAEEGEENGRKVTLSFSSEEPYERWWGIEILDHAEGAADLGRLNEIGCLLFNHNRDCVIGKILRAWVEDGRVAVSPTKPMNKEAVADYIERVEGFPYDEVRWVSSDESVNTAWYEVK